MGQISGNLGGYIRGPWEFWRFTEIGERGVGKFKNGGWAPPTLQWGRRKAGNQKKGGKKTF